MLAFVDRLDREVEKTAGPNCAMEVGKNDRTLCGRHVLERELLEANVLSVAVLR